MATVTVSINHIAPPEALRGADINNGSLRGDGGAGMVCQGLPYRCGLMIFEKIIRYRCGWARQRRAPPWRRPTGTCNVPMGVAVRRRRCGAPETLRCAGDIAVRRRRCGAPETLRCNVSTGNGQRSRGHGVATPLPAPPSTFAPSTFPRSTFNASVYLGRRRRCDATSLRATCNVQRATCNPYRPSSNACTFTGKPKILMNPSASFWL